MLIHFFATCSGCIEGYFGNNCSECSSKCVNNTCHNETGDCLNCEIGYIGKRCELALYFPKVEIVVTYAITI